MLQYEGKEFEAKKREYEEFCEKMKPRQKQLDEERKQEREIEKQKRKEEKQKWDNERPRRLVMTRVENLGESDEKNVITVRKHLDLCGLISMKDQKFEVKPRISKAGRKIFFLVFPSVEEAKAVIRAKAKALERARFPFFIDQDQAWQERQRNRQ